MNFVDTRDVSRPLRAGKLSGHRSKIIDGWRGLSVTLVVIGHAVSYRFAEYWQIHPLHNLIGHPELLIGNVILRLAADLGGIGVQFFFVISGFLITRLLVVEDEQTGRISVSAFYIRRVFRILPAFYLYMIVIFALRDTGAIVTNDEAFVRSTFFICNLSGFGCSWWLAHTWSLSVEEQFYLVWPLVFILLGRFRILAIVCILVTLMIGSYSFSLHDLASFAYIAIGALIALSERAGKFIANVSTTSTIMISGAVIVFEPLMFPLPLVVHMIEAAGPLLTAVVLFGTLNRRGGVLLRLVSSPILQKIGLISYSIYLWQQFSLAPNFWGGLDTGAARFYAIQPIIMLLMFVPISILSYTLLERPLIKLGHRISNRIINGSVDVVKQSVEANLMSRLDP